MTLGELVMGQALHDLRLIFADENEHTCSTLPDSILAALELRLESAAGGADTVMAQMLRLEATQVNRSHAASSGTCSTDLVNSLSRSSSAVAVHALHHLKLQCCLWGLSGACLVQRPVSTEITISPLTVLLSRI